MKCLSFASSKYCIFSVTTYKEEISYDFFFAYRVDSIAAAAAAAANARRKDKACL
jgi:hypothetical protein